LVKPKLSHVFFARFQQKYLVVNCYDELVTTLQKVADTNIEFLLMEYIEGADDQLSSYYTYLDADGQPLFHFTKRVIRRYPINQGMTCYHITDHNDEVRELSLRLFQQAGLRGVANAEFKRDARDGALKLIECNARFTAANGLVAESGFDLGRFVYDRVTGRKPAELTVYRDNMRLWYPVEDFLAFLQLRRRGELTLRQWLASIMHRKSLPIFRWTDPLPSLVGRGRHAARCLGKALGSGALWAATRKTDCDVCQAQDSSP
jgi:predicted ATP-grasp superfamily ATP-dependent carboligase